MITIERLTAPFRKVDVTVQANQQEFVATVQEVLAKLDELAVAFAVRLDEQDIGFFTLTPSINDPVEQLRSISRCTLGAFMIDHKYQGKGYAAQVLKVLPSFVPDIFGEDISIGLTVNCRNKQAYELYEKNGFHDIGEIYEGGGAGPQHIMMMNLTTN